MNRHRIVDILRSMSETSPAGRAMDKGFKDDRWLGWDGWVTPVPVPISVKRRR